MEPFLLPSPFVRLELTEEQPTQLLLGIYRRLSEAQPSAPLAHPELRANLPAALTQQLLEFILGILTAPLENPGVAGRSLPTAFPSPCLGSHCKYMAPVCTNNRRVAGKSPGPIAYMACSLAFGRGQGGGLSYLRTKFSVLSCRSELYTLYTLLLQSLGWSLLRTAWPRSLASLAWTPGLTPHIATLSSLTCRTCCSSWPLKVWTPYLYLTYVRFSWSPGLYFSLFTLGQVSSTAANWQKKPFTQCLPLTKSNHACAPLPRHTTPCWP